MKARVCVRHIIRPSITEHLHSNIAHIVKPRSMILANWVAHIGLQL